MKIRFQNREKGLLEADHRRDPEVPLHSGGDTAGIDDGHTITVSRTVRHGGPLASELRIPWLA